MHHVPTDACYGLHMYDKRLHVLIDEARLARISLAARSRKVSVAEVVREAIDVALPPVWPDRRVAGDEILRAEPMVVPADVAALKAELLAARGDRLG